MQTLLFTLRCATKRCLFLIAVMVSLTLMACSTGGKTVWDGPPSSEAEAAYREGLSRMERGQFIESTKVFSEMRLKYPYSSRWSTLAELRLADILFQQGRHAVAAVAYQEFINGHPSHEEAAYAMYQIGLCYYEQMPSDIFLLPRPWQRELISAQQAETAFRRFFSRHPDHPLADDAREKTLEIRTRLAMHHLYVAEFNFRRKAYHGAILRLTTLLKDFPEAEVIPQARFLLAHAYLQENDAVSAAEQLQHIVAAHPDSSYHSKAAQWLRENAVETPNP